MHLIVFLLFISLLASAMAYSQQISNDLKYL